VIEIDERITGPKLLLKLFPGDDLTRLSDESRKNSQRLSLQPHTNSMLAQLARRLVKGERAKNEMPRNARGGLAAHGGNRTQG